jgi:hypothetical protein
MADRGPNSDQGRVDKSPGREDRTYEDATYLGTDEEDDVEVQDLGFIVDDREDRRIAFPGAWQRLDEIDTDEPLEEDRTGATPKAHDPARRGLPPEAFATDYNVSHAEGEEQEDDFAETSMLQSDPDREDGDSDFTDETLRELDGDLMSTDIAGHVAGVTRGLGTRTPQDIGAGGFQIRDNPLMQPQGSPVSSEPVSDEALGLRDLDDMGDEEDLDRLADQGARLEEERQSGRAPGNRRRG